MGMWIDPAMKPASRSAGSRTSRTVWLSSACAAWAGSMPRETRALQIPHRIDGAARRSDLEVQVGPSREAGGADPADDLANRHHRADADLDVGLVRVERGQTVTVIDDHGVAVPTSRPGPQ